MSDQFDMRALMEQAQVMQQQIAEAQAAAAEQVVEGQAGGGMVRVTVTGALEIRSVTIDPQVVDPEDVTLLEDMVLAAFNDAMARAQDLTRQSLGGIDLGPLGLGGEGTPGLAP